MYAAGKRETHPPDRLIDHLLQSVGTTMSPTTTGSTTLTTTTTAVSQAAMASENFELESTPKVEATISDLIVLMNRHASDSAKRFDRLENKFGGFSQRQDAVESRVAKTEKNLSILHRNFTDQQNVNQQTYENVALLSADVEGLKETMKLIQSTVNVPPPSSQAPPFRPISNSTEAHTNELRPSVNHSSQSYASTSVNQSERFTDVVSEFTGHRSDLHPEKFLSQLDQYLLYNCPYDDQRVELFQRRLTGSSRVWFDSLMPVPTTYEEAKTLFRQQFWSAATQRKIRNEIFQPYQYRSPVGITTHAMTWIAKAKYLSPPIDQFDLVGIIIQHYPSTLGMAIRGRGPQTTNALLSVLTEIEESTSFCDTPNPPQSAWNNEQPPRDFNERREYQSRNNNRNNNRNNYRNGPNRGPQNNYRPPAQNEEPVHQLNASGNESQSRQ